MRVDRSSAAPEWWIGGECGFTIVAVWILALGYFGLDAIATEMEDPVRPTSNQPEYSRPSVPSFALALVLS